MLCKLDSVRCAGWLCLERVLGAVMIKLLDDVDWLSGFNILEPGVCPYFSKKIKYIMLCGTPSVSVLMAQIFFRLFLNA
jgi:hypothetical protein